MSKLRTLVEVDGSVLYERRMHRSATAASLTGRTDVVQQAEAKGAFRPRNSVKMRVIRKIGKSFENLAAQKEVARHKTSIEERGEVKHVQQSAKTDTAASIPKPSTPAEATAASSRKQSTSTSLPRGQARLIRSMSDVGLVKLASIRFRRRDTCTKRGMVKDWHRRYGDLCYSTVLSSVLYCTAGMGTCATGRSSCSLPSRWRRTRSWR